MSDNVDVKLDDKIDDKMDADMEDDSDAEFEYDDEMDNLVLTSNIVNVGRLDLYNRGMILI